MSPLRFSFFKKIGGMGRTDRQTDGRGATLNAALAPKEGHIKRLQVFCSRLSKPIVLHWYALDESLLGLYFAFRHGRKSSYSYSVSFGRAVLWTDDRTIHKKA